ncbi:MAG: 16S rRNA (guanine(966)-N(2))-methyltransferase RsmD [Rhodobacteraceae bacterium]|nr:16S rRNA (guanine(966)-N(2))-methyltransferase RsmD [Paracoccaceae bacterium]
MRIIGGTWRGLTLASLGKGDSAAHLRPTSDRVRESLFNLLQNGPYDDPVEGARVLDLFAGTGALGLEALSREARCACFVDSGAKAGALLAENIARTRSGDRARALRRDALKLGPNPEEPFGLIFVDPPYGKGLGERALLAAARGGWIADGALIVFEEGKLIAAPDGFTLLDHRRYGDTHIHILRYAA